MQMRNPPNPSNYCDREEYEEACEKWRKARNVHYGTDYDGDLDEDEPVQDRDCDYWGMVMSRY